MNTPRTHILVRDVLVDVPGRDSIRDFLAQFGNGYKVYESENTDTDVTDRSDSSSLNGSGNTYTLSSVATAGFMYVRLTDPTAGKSILKEVKRSDGKIIKLENAWLSKSRDSNNNWQYFFNLFDVSTTNSYTVIFQDPAAGPQAPVIQFIPDRVGMENQQIGFIVEASDPNGTVPKLSAAMIPAGAKFTDTGNGRGEFRWTPSFGQTGKYNILFTASDGVLSSSRSAALNIQGQDSDNDGLPDYWEMKYFGNLSKDGKEDSDGDGISDIDEYRNGTNPFIMPGDINRDKKIDLKDVILALQVLSGLTPANTIYKEADVNGDSRIGLEEIVYILQVVSDVRR
ncbi:MAG: hypothetical protein HC887_10490 [Desulfobacteraceae bacterium]|nr:hypothetical protein [Desulfobacteraceae bacterium]